MVHKLRLGVELPGHDLLAAMTGADHLIPRYIKQLKPAFLLVGGERQTSLSSFSPNPFILAGWLSRKLNQVGLVVTGSFQRDHPFNLARRIASLDHMSEGRTGIVITSEDHGQFLGLEGKSSWTDAPLNGEAVADGMTAMRKLWRSWPRETLDADSAVSAAAVVRFANHKGIFSSLGPLNSPTTRQGEPLLFWHAGPSGWQEQDLLCVAAADAVILDHSLLDTFTAWASAQLDSAQALGEPIQIHVRIPLQDLKLDTFKQLEMHPAVTAIIIACDRRTLPDLVDTVLTVPRLSTLIEYNQPSDTLRSVLEITRRSHPDIEANSPAFSGKVPESA
jgi:hypothetical protein